jgi:2-polyprenyl-3-methyl-5-hydroxy-6-metoxy-1,4-benzoquinol methylase
MGTKPRQFGVSDHDLYWRERKAASRTSEKRVHRFILQMIQTYFPKGGRVVDCGVGDGHVFRLCQEHNYDTYGVEYSEEAISWHNFPRDRVAQADLNNGIPDFGGIKFDAIVISMVLHWLNDPEDFLRRSAARLTPDGRIFANIPNITNYRYRIGFLFGKFPTVSLSHKNFQTPTECEAMFAAAGYRIETMAPTKGSLKARLWPRLFGSDILYVLKPVARSNGAAAA